MPQKSIPAPQVKQSASLRDMAVSRGPVLRRWGSWLENITFFFLCLFVVLWPHSIKGAQHAWQIAFLLWLVTLTVERRRPFPQPLAAPLLAYVVLSAISTLLSPDPYLSWDRMKLVCLVLVGIVVAQSVRRLSQVRILIVLLVLSGLAAATFTAWQYTYGVGVRVVYIAPGSPLENDAYIHTDYIVTGINGRPVHTAAQLERIVQQSPPGSILRVDYMRGWPFHRHQTIITRERFLGSGLGTPALQLVRAHPSRAQGTLGHYVIFAEVLMQIGCIVWALLLNTTRRQSGIRFILALAFLALTAAMFATETRAALAGLAAGCFVAVLTLAGKHTRLWAAAGLLVLVIVAALWIHHTRGQGWTGARDPGTHFRTLMWEDGLRLIRQHPWFGVGMETIRNHWRQWNIRGFALYPNEQSHFHSDAIQIAVDRGLPALAAWLWFVVGYIIFLPRLARKAALHNHFACGVAVGLLSAFVAFLLPGLLHYNLGEETLVMGLFFFYGLSVAIARIVEEPRAIRGA
jgi:O-antigen ligase